MSPVGRPEARPSDRLTSASGWPTSSSGSPTPRPKSRPVPKPLCPHLDSHADRLYAPRTDSGGGRSGSPADHDAETNARNPLAAPDYEYDIFVSYHRGQRLVPGGKWPLSDDGRWVHRVFMPCFEHWMKQENPDVRIAFDQRLDPGVQWRPTLQNWVKRSRIMLAIWNAPYFRSDFCRCELYSMLRRQDTLRSQHPDLRLVIPIVYYDGQWFDAEAKAIQFSKDFSQFSAYTRPIKNERVSSQLVTRLQALCRDVHLAIQAAPPFDPAFPWIEDRDLPKQGHSNTNYPNPSLQ